MEGLQQSQNSRREALLAEIKHAHDSAPWLPESVSFQDQINAITASFLRGEISGLVLQDKIEAIDSRAGVIKKKGLIEFRDLLRAVGLTEEDVRETIAHENAHMNEAITLGVDPVYRIQFVKIKTNDDGTVETRVQPSIDFDFPRDMSDIERRKKLRQIIEAPDDPSPGDMVQLNVTG